MERVRPCLVVAARGDFCGVYLPQHGTPGRSAPPVVRGEVRRVPKATKSRDSVSLVIFGTNDGIGLTPRHPPIFISSYCVSLRRGVSVLFYEPPPEGGLDLVTNRKGAI